MLAYVGLLSFASPKKYHPRILAAKGYGPRFPPFDFALSTTVVIFFVVQAKHLIFGRRGDESSLFDLILVGVVTLYSCHLLFAFPGIPYSHDLNHYISTIAATKVKLSSWDGLSRWTHIFWCGIPLLRFYSPLLLLSSSILPLDPLQSVKTVLVAVRFASAYVVYFTSGKMLEDKSLYQPSGQKLDVETQTKYPRALFAKYVE